MSHHLPRNPTQDESNSTNTLSVSISLHALFAGLEMLHVHWCVTRWMRCRADRIGRLWRGICGMGCLGLGEDLGLLWNGEGFGEVLEG
jgi:hypothetical protein